jgi:hypothetical protein
MVHSHSYVDGTVNGKAARLCWVCSCTPKEGKAAEAAILTLITTPK